MGNAKSATAMGARSPLAPCHTPPHKGYTHTHAHAQGILGDSLNGAITIAPMSLPISCPYCCFEPSAVILAVLCSL